MIPWRHAALVVASTVAFLLAYPPFNFPVAAFVALVPVVWLMLRLEATEAPAWDWWKTGFWFGAVLNAVTLYWMVAALWRFTPLSVLGYLAAVACLGTLLGVYFMAIHVIRVAWPRLSLLVVLPVLWTAGEWTVGHLPQVAFPWLGLGTALAAFPLLAQTAEWWGARGLTCLLVLANAALALALLPAASRRRRLATASIILAGTLLAAGFGLVRERTLRSRTVGRVALVQPNLPFDAKADPARQDAIVEQLLSLSRGALQSDRADLLVWPEAAVPDYLYRHREWRDQIQTLIADTRTPLVIGAPHVVFFPDDRYEYFNAAFFVDSTGRLYSSSGPPETVYPVYHKRYLVPIVERVPFVNPRWFRSLRWFGGFGRGTDPPVYRSAIGRFGVAICYESAFEHVFREYRASGADFLVNITNDAWFGRTSAPYQHFAHLVLRAVETRAGIARAANSGISALIDPRGRVTEATALDRTAVIVADLQTSDVQTVYATLGDWVGQSCLALSILLVGSAGLRFRRRTSGAAA